MRISDEFPSKKDYDDGIELTPEREQQFLEEEKAALARFEQGDISLLRGIISSYMWRKDRREIAFRACEAILEKSDKKDWVCEAYYVLAGLHTPEEQYDKTLEYLLKGYEVDPLNGYICRGLIILYYHLKEYDKALEVALPEHEHYYNDLWNPTDEPNHNIEMCERIGLCYAAKEDYKTAIQWFENGLSDREATHESWNEKRAHLHYYIGQSWQYMDDEYRARAAYKKAIELKAHMPEVYNNLGGLAFNHHGNVQEAIDLMNKALEFIDEDSPSSTVVWKNLRMLYNTIADYDKEAYAHYKVLCSMGWGFLFQDPSKVEEYEGNDDDDDDDSLSFDYEADSGIAEASPEDDLDDLDDISLESM